MQDKLASTVGFLVAPAVAGTAFALSSPALGGGLSASFSSIAGLSALGYVWALGFTGIFGLPLFLLVRRYWSINLFSSVGGGVMVGLAVAAVLVSGEFFTTRWLSALVEASPFSLVTGALSGAAFWLVRTLCLTKASSEL